MNIFKQDEYGALELFKGDWKRKSIPEMLAMGVFIVLGAAIMLALVLLIIAIPAIGVYKIVDKSESVFLAIAAIAPVTFIVGFIGFRFIGYGRLAELSQALVLFSAIGFLSSLVGLYFTGSYPSILQNIQNNHSIQNVLIVSAIVIVLVAIYFHPTLVSYSRGHQSRLAIFFTNLLLGWSVVGWLFALIWSGTGVRRNA